MEILAGLVAGLVMGLIFLGVAVVKIVTTRDINERVQRVMPKSIAPSVAIMVLVMGVPPALGAVGAIAGLIYRLFDRAFPGAGLGSNNMVFTLVVLGVAAGALLVVLALRKKVLWLPLGLAIAIAAVFGWVLPLMAGI